MSKINTISYWLFLVLPSALFFEKIVASILIAILFLFKIPIIFQLKSLKLLLKQKILLLSILYFVLHAIALLFTNDTQDGLNSLEIILSFFVLPLIGITFKRNNKSQKINHQFIDNSLFIKCILCGLSWKWIRKLLVFLQRISLSFVANSSDISCLLSKFFAQYFTFSRLEI